MPCCVPVLRLGRILVTNPDRELRGGTGTHVLQHPPASPAPQGSPRRQARLWGALLPASELTQAQQSPTAAFFSKKRAPSACLSSASSPAQTPPCPQDPDPTPQALCRARGQGGTGSGAVRGEKGLAGAHPWHSPWGRQRGQGTDPAYLIQIVEKALEERGEG